MTLTLDIPNDVESDKRVRLALALYDARVVSQDKAAQIAGLSLDEFQDAVGETGVLPPPSIPTMTPEMAEELAALKNRRIPQSLDEMTPRVPTPPGMTAMQMIRGQWPGDETEEELLALLAADRAKDPDRAKRRR